MYLGATLEEKELNGQSLWTMSSKQYIKTAVEIAEEGATKRGMKLSSRAITPMNGDYYPELDRTIELEPEDITFYQELIGMLRWAIEIGGVDIYTEVSVMSAYQAAPRQGHLEQLLHVFVFLKKKPKLTLYLIRNYLSYLLKHLMVMRLKFSVNNIGMQWRSFLITCRDNEDRVSR